MTIALTVFASVLGTATLSGIFGMGGGMILMGVLALALPLSTAMILHGVTQLGANGYRALLLRQHIQWPIVARLVVGGLAALGLFAWLQLRLDVKAVFLVLGGLPLVVLVLPRDIKLDVARGWQAVVCGALFIALQLVAGASGPILDAFFLRGRLGRFEIVATKATISSIGHISKLLYWGVLLRSASASELPGWIFVLAVATAFVGTRIGRAILGALAERQFHRYSRALITAIAVLYLARGLL